MFAYEEWQFLTPTAYSPLSPVAALILACTLSEYGSQ